MKSLIKFGNYLIAPCGMNCGTCIAYLREKNKCFGCNITFQDKCKSRTNCKIKNCEFLEKKSPKFCYNCVTFPCTRLKKLDIRYRTKYNTGLIQNLQIIKESGIDKFLHFELKRRTCSKCGSILSVHRNKCILCSNDY